MDGKSAYAKLTSYAARWWDNAVYQLAHELVHLLDPRPVPPHGPGATWYEEGIATSFSAVCLKAFSGKVWETKGDYGRAYACVQAVDKDHLKLASELRVAHGHLSDIPKDSFIDAGYHPLVAEQLSRRFQNKDLVALDLADLPTNSPTRQPIEESAERR